MHEPAPGAGPAPSWLLAADGGPKTRGRPIHGRLESDDGDSEARAEPDESAGDLARIHGVTPSQDPPALRQRLAAAETIADALGHARLQRTASRTPEPDTHGNRPMTR